MSSWVQWEFAMEAEELTADVLDSIQGSPAKPIHAPEL